MAPILQLAGRNFKITMINMLQSLEEMMDIMEKQKGNFRNNLETLAKKSNGNLRTRKHNTLNQKLTGLD